MNTRVPTFISICFLGISIVASVFLVTKTMQDISSNNGKLTAQQLRNEAVDQCGKIAVAEYKDLKDGSVITEPFKPTYVACLKDKGYESNVSL